MSTELTADIRRITLPLPGPPGHVHAYLLRDRDGGWTLVDTGLAVPGLEEQLQEEVTALAEPVVRVVITHFHPDHVGGAAVAAEVTGAPVFQGALDYAQCVRVWGSEGWPARVDGWFVANGLPAEAVRRLRASGSTYARWIRFVRDPRPLREGDRIGGWDVVELPGHADGHLCLVDDGRFLSGDHLLPRISPTIGLYPGGSADPLGDYLASLERTVALAPRVAFPGHGDPIHDPVGRARELTRHHRERLDETAAALDGRPRSGFEVSLALFPRELDPLGRRFAVAETLAHLARLVVEGRAVRHEHGENVAYTGTTVLGRRPSQ